MIDDFLPIKKPETNGEPTSAPELSTDKVGPAGPYRPQAASSTPQLKNVPDTVDAVASMMGVRPSVSDSPVAADQTDDSEKPKKAKSSKKKLAIIVALVVVLLGGGFAGWWFVLKPDNKPKTVSSVKATAAPKATITPVATPKLVVASLSGLMVDSATAARPVSGIMIENSEEARPQSGLNDADVIFEAIAEGGITRFLALFQSKAPEYIGPVRSARPYYVEWAKMFDASYSHAGGSPDGLQKIKDIGVKDINAFSYGEDSFYRITERFAPHNLYAKFSGIDKINAAIGNTKSDFKAWSRKQDVPQTATASTIDISISGPDFGVHYVYDAGTNTYKRSEGGEVHKDAKSGTQLAPKVVVVLEHSYSQNGIYSVYGTTGTGKVRVFQDGVMSEGTWSRTGNENYVLKDKNGFDMKLNAGQTWVTAVSSLSDVTSK